MLEDVVGVLWSMNLDVVPITHIDSGYVVLGSEENVAMMTLGFQLSECICPTLTWV